MLQSIQARHYKCLKMVSVPLQPLNILIGPNASGKSTLLDILVFLRDAFQGDVEDAVRRRAANITELIWRGENIEQGFAFALEVNIPADQRVLSNGDTLTYDRLRYEVSVGLGTDGSLVVSGENLWMVDTHLSRPTPAIHPTSFPRESEDTDMVIRQARTKTPPGYRLIVRKVAESGNDYFRSERTDWNIMFRLSPRRLALSGVPEDQERFPLTLWFRQFLLNNVHFLQLNSVLMRRTCPSDAPRIFQPDGSNLPLMVAELRKEPQRFQWWLGHLQTILEDLEDVTVEEREEDRSRYLALIYRGGLRVPAWLLSDGTLRLLALTLLAYLPQPAQIFLIEEPENGIHPRAVEAVFQSLASLYDGQVFLATHSPLVLALAEPEHLMIFGKTADGATDVVRGSEHPALHAWRKEIPLETLFAAGVLG
ncbi:MAG TPA: ATP-binding protein [Anaerolineae bacterium]|nr:ATP-binding protein [Anaerolineae bacterium]HQK14916.1 ATP-binding protein [Anaerolineae bacterium]